MLPGSKLKLTRRVWSKSCAELAKLGRAKDMIGYELLSPKDNERRASAESLDSGYTTTCSVLDYFDPEKGFPHNICNTSPSLIKPSTTNRHSLRSISRRRHSRHSRTGNLQRCSMKDNVVHWKAKVE